MTDPPALSVVIPAYDEAGRLHGTLEALGRWAQSWRDGDVQIIVVDDGSSDGTGEIAEAWRGEGGRAARVIRAAHRGKGSAVARGMVAATGSVRAFMDADLAVPVEMLESVVDGVRSGADVVIGSRELRGSSRQAEPRLRHWMGRIFNWLVIPLAVRGIPDTQCGFKGFSATAAEEIFNRVRLYPADVGMVSKSRVTGFDVELLAIAQTLGLQIAQIPVAWRHVEQSSVRPLPDALSMVWDVLRVRWHLARGHYGRAIG